MRNTIRRTLLGALLASAATGVALAAPTAASAAVTMTLNPATVHGSDFTWSCVVNAGGGTTYVDGASWLAPGGGFVETSPRVKVTGSTNVTVPFTRDGDPN